MWRHPHWYHCFLTCNIDVRHVGHVYLLVFSFTHFNRLWAHSVINEMAESSSIQKIEKLNGKNFASWKYNIKLLLWNIVNGMEKKPVIKTEDAGKPEIITKINSWELRSDKAYSIIAINIEKDLQIHVQSTTDPSEAWELLKKHFELTSISHIVRLTRRFYAASMREDEDLEVDVISSRTS